MGMVERRLVLERHSRDARPMNWPNVNWQNVTTQPCELGESPFWQPQEQMLYWVDIAGQCLHGYAANLGHALGAWLHRARPQWRTGDCPAPRRVQLACPGCGPGYVADWVTATMVTSADYAIGAQVWIQAKAVLTTVVWSGVVSFIAFKVVDLTIGLRVSEEDEREGLDITSHGETAYNR